MATRARKTRKRSPKKGASAKKRAKRRWAQSITSVSTFPPEGLFTKDAATIARVMATKKVSPKGIGSGIRMVQMFINRAGKNLSATRRRELERAKRILQDKKEQEK